MALPEALFAEAARSAPSAAGSVPAAISGKAHAEHSLQGEDSCGSPAAAGFRREGPSRLPP